MPSEKTSILFVDDDPSLLASLRRLFHRFSENWEMGFCSSAEEALNRLENQHTDVVVSDIRMPDMDGAELMRAVAQNYPRVIRFIMSGQAEKAKVLELVEVTHQYFTKPCNPNKLFDAVSGIMAKRQQIDCDQLSDQLTGLAWIPIGDQSYADLKAELAETEPNINRVVEIVRGDVGLGMKVLQLFSTSFFGSPQPGCDLSLACRTLGVDLLGSVFLGPHQQQVTSSHVNDEFYVRVTDHWHVLQQKQNPAAQSSGGKGEAVFDYLMSLWGVHESSLTQQQA